MSHQMNHPPVVERENKAGCRYMLVTVVAKRARQIIDRQSTGDLDVPVISKPLSKAVDELYKGEIKILPEQEEESEED